MLRVCLDAREGGANAGENYIHIVLLRSETMEHCREQV
jgi:hypothetical protein